MYKFFKEFGDREIFFLDFTTHVVLFFLCKNQYICFNALHGPFGEDGAIQKILKKNKFRFTHSNQISSTNCFDKEKSKKLATNGNIFLKNNMTWDVILPKYIQFYEDLLKV